MVSRYEASQGTREIRANHRSVTGWVAGQGAHDPVPFESTLERDFVYLALFERYVSKVQAQPLTLTWKDDHGISRHYTPDFLVEYSTPGVATHRAIVEVKFTDDLNENWAKLEPGFRAMAAWCAENRHHFCVATEKEIRAQRIQNVRAVFPFRFNGRLVSRQVNDEIFREIRRRTPISIGTLLEMAGDDREHRAAIQASIWGLLSVGTIWMDLDEPLGPQSVIHLEAPPQTQLFFTKQLMR